MMPAGWFSTVLIVTLVTRGHVTAQVDECAQHSALYYSQLLARTDWALQMFDASTKLPDGILMGHLQHLGNFDECLAVVAPGDQGPIFRGRYCRVSVNITLGASSSLNDMHQPFANLVGSGLPVPVEWAVCAPSTCDDLGVSAVAETTLTTILGTMMPGAKVQARVSPGTCASMADQAPPLGAATWVTASILIILLVVVLACTVYEFTKVTRDGATNQEVTDLPDSVRAFSLLTTTKQLFSVEVTPRPGTLTCLHGLRALSMAWVILGHTYSTEINVPVINLLSTMNDLFYDNWSMMVIFNGFLAVETFFLLSGLLTSYVFMNDRTKGRPFSVLQYYVYRYLRLTAPLVVVVFFLANIAEHMGSGPLWNFAMRGMVESCQQHWWATLLYVNNYINQTVCVVQSWYLCVDMQLSWLAPLALFPLRRWPRYTFRPFLVLLITGLCFVTFTETYIEHYPWTMTIVQPAGVNPNFGGMVYTHTEHRAVPYVVGILVGYYLSTPKDRNLVLSKEVKCVGWMLSISFALAVVFGLSKWYTRGFQYDDLEAAFYGGFHRLAWSLSISWIVIACTNGFGGVVNDILSWPAWQPFSRLSYCAYLTHFSFMYFVSGLAHNPHSFSHFGTIHRYFSTLFFTFFLSVVLYLTVEAPASNLLRALFDKDGKKKDGENETVKNT